MAVVVCSRNSSGREGLGGWAQGEEAGSLGSLGVTLAHPQVWMQVQEPAVVRGREGPAASPSSTPFRSQGDFPLLPWQSLLFFLGSSFSNESRYTFIHAERWERRSKWSAYHEQRPRSRRTWGHLKRGGAREEGGVAWAPWRRSPHGGEKGHLLCG